MLAHPIDPYKYYLRKVQVATYMDDACLFEHAFSCVRSSKFSKISLVQVITG